MADTFTINLQEQYRKAFGINRRIFQAVKADGQRQEQDFTQGEELSNEAIQFDSLPKLQFDTSPAKSSLGTVVLSPITFKGGSYKKRLSNGQIINSTYEELSLTHTATVEVSLKKIIVKTPRYGGLGNFKEKVGTDDPRIIIRGFLIGKDLKRPQKQIRQLHDLNEVPNEVKVVCDYLGWLNIHHLVIEDVKFPNLIGQPATQPFEMTCSGDVPIELI